MSDFQLKETIVEKIKNDLKNSEDVLDVIKDKFSGRTAFVISAGPSAEKWRSILDAEGHNNPVVVCVKQSVNLVGDLCQIHFFNNVNLVKYESNERILTFYMKSPDMPSFGHYDITYDFIPTNFDESISVTHDFERFELSASGMLRPYGPGIMMETVIYSLIHMGFERIVTIGWDIADSRGMNKHFDDSNDLSDKNKNAFCVKKLVAKAIPSKRIRFFLKYIIEGLKFYSGKKINVTSAVPGEAEIMAQGVVAIKKWLKKKNVDLIIHSDSKWMN